MLNKKNLNLLKDRIFLYETLWHDYRIKLSLYMVSFIMTLTILTTAALSAFSINDTISNISNANLPIKSASLHDNFTDNADKKKGCNCVVFRMDDIQDYWLNKVQLEIMDLFLNKNETISLGLIMNAIGNDSQIVDMIKVGLNENLFELSLHGWNHTEYTNLTSPEQKESLLNSKNKMYNLFGKNSSVFIPPLSVFNNETLKVMTELGLKVISSDIPEETKLMNGKSIFVAKNLDGNQRYNETTSTKKGQNNSVYHMPATIFFKDYEKGEWIKIPNNEIIANSTKNIEIYGYSVIVLHPQDFASLSNKSTPQEPTYSNSINMTEIADLSNLIDTIKGQKIRVMGFEDIVNQYGN